MEARKAERVVVLDVSRFSMATDYFVIASADNRIHLRALVDLTRERLRQQGVRLRHMEGYEQSGWVLMDYGDVVVHCFLEDQRQFYSLERLWADAPRLDCSVGNAEGSNRER